MTDVGKRRGGKSEDKGMSGLQGEMMAAEMLTATPTENV